MISATMNWKSLLMRRFIKMRVAKLFFGKRMEKVLAAPEPIKHAEDFLWIPHCNRENGVMIGRKIALFILQALFK
jgi:hypothetical protein